LASNIATEIYRADDAPNYYRGNKVLISICVLAAVILVSQRQYFWILNRRKQREWDEMTSEEKEEYQMDQVAREKEGNRRLDFRFTY
jgi:hypothetical protein